MGIYGYDNFPTKAKFTVKFFLIILMLALPLVACSNKSDSDKGEVEGNTADPDLQTIQMGEDDAENIPLNLNIDSLVLEENIALSISQHDGVFIPTSSSFTQRIIGLLESHDDAVAKVVDIDNYDLVLRFDGYSDIHLNLDTNTFWFTDSDHLYPIQHSFSAQWDRYIIRIVDGKLMYDSFEKTILQKNLFSDGDGTTKNTATLFFDGDIRLRINNAETVIASNVSEGSLDFNNSKYPLSSYSMKTFGEKSLIAVVYDYPTAHGHNTKLDLFSYNNEDIQKVFSTSDMTYEIDSINYKNGEVTIKLPFANKSMTLILTNEERELTDEKLQEFIKNNVKIDDDYIKSIKDGISPRPIGVEFIDINGDGIEEILISVNIESIGARTPVKINSNVVFIFEMINNSLQYKDVICELPTT